MIFILPFSAQKRGGLLSRCTLGGGYGLSVQVINAGALEDCGYRICQSYLWRSVMESLVAMRVEISV